MLAHRVYEDVVLKAEVSRETSPDLVMFSSKLTTLRNPNIPHESRCVHKH